MIVNNIIRNLNHYNKGKLYFKISSNFNYNYLINANKFNTCFNHNKNKKEKYPLNSNYRSLKTVSLIQNSKWNHNDNNGDKKKKRDDQFESRNVFIKNFLLYSSICYCYIFYKWFYDSNGDNNWIVYAKQSENDNNNDNVSDLNDNKSHDNDDDNNDDFIPGQFIDGLPIYSMKEVSKHNDPKTTGVWIVFKYGVYDVTEFIDYHPGGENILLGAGNSIEPFWKIYSQHYNKKIYEILESYRIGNLNKDEIYKEDTVKAKDDEDLRKQLEIVPERDPSLIVHHEKPFNAETPGEILIQNYYTPNDKFFIRNHLSVPKVDLDDYVLEIEGFGLEKTFEFTLEELKTLFPKHTVTSVIQCGGNRRNDLNQVKEVKGIPWRLGAIGNTKWTGAKLIDVLNYCNAELDHPKIFHVQFEGLDLDATGSPYGASVPSDKALDPNAEFLLAYEMNDEPLPFDHGFPVRLIAPGIVGARNVKWLSKIILSDHESKSHWQRNDYKSFPSNKDHATPEEFSKAYAIQEMPIQSAICLPKNNDQVSVVWRSIKEIENNNQIEGENDDYDDDQKIKPFIEVSGYAWSGGGKKIIRVDLSIDGGKNWYEAKMEQEETDANDEKRRRNPLKGPSHTYSWTLWKCYLPIDLNDGIYNGKNLQIICRAFDSSYNTQPSNIDEIWNFRGLLNNSWHKINVEIR